MNITKRLLLGYGIIIILLAVLTGYFTFSQLDQMSELNSRSIDNIGASQEQLARLEASLFQVQDAAYKFYSDLSQESLQVFSDALQKVFIHLVSIRTAYSDQGLAELIDPIEQKVRLQIQIMKDLGEMSSSAKLKNSNVASDFTPQTLLAEINPIGLISDIQKFFRGQMLNDKLLSMQIGQNTYMYLGIIFLIAVVAGIIIGIIISRSITTTIRRSSDQVTDVSDEILETSEQESETSLTQSEEISQASKTLKGLSLAASEVDSGTVEVKDYVKKTAEQMTRLKEATEKINKIANIIEEISQQINILSLNASIEAFRAGEQGKGFSAVAMEIRKLAENTRSSTEGISALVKDIQQSTSITANSMQVVVEKVNQIVKVVNHQHTDTDQISETVMRINQNMQNSVENIQKTKASAEELHQVALKLRSLI